MVSKRPLDSGYLLHTTKLAVPPGLRPAALLGWGVAHVAEHRFISEHWLVSIDDREGAPHTAQAAGVCSAAGAVIGRPARLHSRFHEWQRGTGARAL